MVYKNVVEYCEKNNMSIAAFEKKCGLANGVVGKWEDDKMKPSLVSLERISDATGISIEKWLK